MANKNQVELKTLKDLTERLADFEASDLPVVSLYLNAQPNQHGRDAFDSFVRKELTRQAKTFADDTPQRESIDADIARINRYLEKQVEPSAHGIAIFACNGADNFFEAVQLEAPIEKNQLFVYNQPHLYPLARLLEQYQRYAVLLADTNAARIFVIALGKAVQRDEIKNLKTNRTQVGGWSQMRFQRHVRNYHLHHAKEVVDTLERLLRDEGISHVILAGDEETIIPLLREQMSKELSEKIIDVLPLGIDTSEHELLEESLSAYRRYDSLSDMEKVDHLLQEYRGDGLAVAGVPQTLAALSNGQIDELIMTAQPTTLQYDENEVKKVLRAYGADAEKLERLDQRTVADELVRRANELSAASVTFIEDDNALATVGGVGGLLRYRVTLENPAPYEHGKRISTSEALLKTDQGGNEDVGQGSAKERSQAQGQGK